MGYEDFLRLGVPFVLGLVVGGYARGVVRAFLAVAGMMLVGYVGLYPEEGKALLERGASLVEPWVRWVTERVVEVFAFAVNRPHDFVVWLETTVRGLPPMWAFWAGVLGGLRG